MEFKLQNNEPFQVTGTVSNVSKSVNVLDLPTSIPSISLSNGTVSGNAITSISVSGHTITINKEKTFVELLTGTTSNRPSGRNLVTGMMYFDTTLGQPIWYNGTDWVDAMGNVAGTNYVYTQNS